MATTSFRMSAREGQKNLVNSENNENLSNYQLWKPKPSLWSISLHFSVFLMIVQLYFTWHRSLQWFQLKFRAGNFPGRDRVRVHCACSYVWPRLNQGPFSILSRTKHWQIQGRAPGGQPPLFLDQLSPLFSTKKEKFSDSKLGWLPVKMALEPSQLFVSHVNGLRVW